MAKLSILQEWKRICAVFLKKKKKFQNKPLLRAHSDDTVSSICYTRNSVMADKPRRICAICNGLADPLKSPSRTCTFCDFGCSASQGVDISRRTPETGARVGRGHACPLQTRPCPRGLPCRTWLLLIKWYDRTYGDPPEKWVSRATPFKVIQGHQIWHVSIGTYDF